MDYPKTVWTPTGGWYAENVNWKRNTAIVFCGVIALAAYTCKVSAAYERRYHPGPIPIPSQRWSAHTLEDDPTYPQKLAEYKKNKRSLWDRIFQTKEDFLEE